jgi:hypothetical protein
MGRVGRGEQGRVSEQAVVPGSVWPGPGPPRAGAGAHVAPHEGSGQYQRVDSRAVPATSRAKGVNEVEAVSDGDGEGWEGSPAAAKRNYHLCVMIRRGSAEQGVRSFGRAGQSVPAMRP